MVNSMVNSAVALCSPSDYLLQQPFRFLLQSTDIRTDLVKGAQHRRLVEMAGEADFVADLGGVDIDPGVRGIGANFPVEEGFNSSLFQKRHLFGVPQFRIGLVFDNAAFA